MRIFHDNTKDDHSYTKGRQPQQRLQPRIRQLPGDIPRHRFPLCAAAPKRYDYTIGYVNTVVSRACAELRLQSKNADKDTDCILISVLIWWTRRGSNPRPPRCERGALPAEPRARMYCPEIKPISIRRNRTILFYSFQYFLSRLLNEIAEKICSFFIFSLPERSATVLATFKMRS